MQLPSMIGKYELLDFLGGGMSHVYRARDTVIERLVVVKILTDEASADPESKARFLHEAKIAALEEQAREDAIPSHEIIAGLRAIRTSLFG